MKITECEVLSNIKLTDRYHHITVKAPDIVNEISPGQFFNLRCGDASLPFLRRPLSIYMINKDSETIEFLYLVKGIGTKELTSLKEGEFLDVLGPLGHGFKINESWENILLLARGVGIATLAAVAQHALENGIKCTAILSSRTNNDLLATEKLKRLGVEVYKVTEENGTSDVQNVEDIILKILSQKKIDAGFTCGSRRLSKLMEKLMTDYNIPAQIALEENMGCSMGVCYACVRDVQVDDTIQSLRVCHEGPVFDLKKVIL